MLLGRLFIGFGRSPSLIGRRYRRTRIVGAAPTPTRIGLPDFEWHKPIRSCIPSSNLFAEKEEESDEDESEKRERFSFMTYTPQPIFNPQ